MDLPSNISGHSSDDQGRELAPEFREELPESCPPDQASEIGKAMTVYRLARHNPPTENDFKSKLEKQPTLPVPNPCIARGLSVWESLETCKAQIKLPARKNSVVLELTLVPDSGIILHDGGPHITWWPFKATDVLALAKVL